MDFLTQRKFSFQSTALPDDTFAVVSFTGEEGLSKPYRFEIGLAVAITGIDLGAVMGGTAKFTIHRQDGEDVSFSGILAAFEHQHAADGCIFYQATLVPRLWWLTLTRHNQVFLGKTGPEIVTAVLKDAGLTSLDFEFRLQEEPVPHDFVCQYGETHYDFMSRWLAREGIYYFFEQQEGREKIVFTDTRLAHRPLGQAPPLRFFPPGGLADTRREAMQAITAHCGLLPRRVRLKGHNSDRQEMSLTVTAEVDATGTGEVYVYGEHFKTPEAGRRMAAIMAEAIGCSKIQYAGESTAPAVRPGFTVELTGHFNAGFNRKYLPLSVRHEGGQAGSLGVAAGVTGSGEAAADGYRNRFTAIPAGVQYRTPRTTDAPTVNGVISARIDAAGSGKYAEIDERGRYKAILPFDLSGRKDGKASTWLRMATPYAGTGHGLHFPLHKGTEVLIAFIGGNPDRPVIVGAVPDSVHPSVVTGDHPTVAALTTGGGNRIHMEDRPGSERIVLHTPAQSSFVRIGAPNDPPPAAHGSGDPLSGIAKKTDGWLDVRARSRNEGTLGEILDCVGGTRTYFTAGMETDIALGPTIDLHYPEQLTLAPLCSRVALKNLSVNEISVVNAAIDSGIAVNESKAQVSVNRVVDNRLDAVSKRIMMSTFRVGAIKQSIRSTQTLVNTCSQDISAVKDRIFNSVIELKTAGTKLVTAGKKINNAGTSIKNEGTVITEDGQSMTTAGTHITDAGIIMEGL